MMLKPGCSLHSIMADISIRLHCSPFILRLQLHGFSILISHCSFRLHSSLPPPLLFFAHLLILSSFYSGLASLPASLQSCYLSPGAEEFIRHGRFFSFFFFFFACLSVFFPPRVFLLAPPSPNLAPQAGNLGHLLHRICMNDTEPFSPSSTSFRFES